MASAHNDNKLMLIMMNGVLHSDHLDAAQTAFEHTHGDFTARFTAAVEAVFAQMVRPEVFIEIPEHPEQLSKTELDALVRPAADGFLRSYPSKDDLLEQVELIKRRQETRPSWIPRIDRHGHPVPPSDTVGEDGPRRTRLIAAFSELGDVLVDLPASYDERPELLPANGGIGELEAVIHTVLRITSDRSQPEVIAISATANEALVPEDRRWWSNCLPHPTSLPAVEDPGVASELLATMPTLGGLPITDVDDLDPILNAIASAGDWRHSPPLLLDGSAPGDGSRFLAAAQASVAAWDEDGSGGLIVYVHGGCLDETEGRFSSPGPLHSYLLCATRANDGTDTVTEFHRAVLSCPGDTWCHRGGCPIIGLGEAVAFLTPVLLDSDIARIAANHDGWAAAHDAWQDGSHSYRDGDSVLDEAMFLLAKVGWAEVERSEWEGGLEELVARRLRHCLVLSYDPVTRQILLRDGKPNLDGTLDLLRDEGIITGDDLQETVDMSDEAAERWGLEMLATADDALHARIDDLPLAGPIQITVLGLHPQAEGALRTQRAIDSAAAQIHALLATANVL
jgi:hypothetical protein